MSNETFRTGDVGSIAIISARFARGVYDFPSGRRSGVPFDRLYDLNSQFFELGMGEASLLTENARLFNGEKSGSRVANSQVIP